MRHLVCYFDGACWPNPNGHAASGALILCDGEVVFAGSKYIGCRDTTNNVAEYHGLIQVLEKLIELQPDSAIIYGDADMVIKQMDGRWKIRTPKGQQKPKPYIPYCRKAKELRNQIKGQIVFRWIPRDKNERADLLSRQPLVDRGICDCYAKYETEPDRLEAEFEYALFSSR